MTIIQIEPNENGGHANQTTDANISIPTGWAVVPPTLDTPNFPFGILTSEEIDGVMTVTSWTACEIPESEPTPEPVPTLADRVDELDQALNMILTGYTGEEAVDEVGTAE